MYAQVDLDKLAPIRQYTFYYGVTAASLIFVWGYYVLLLLRISNYSMPVLIIAYVCTYIGLFLGLLTGSVFIGKIGYTRLYRYSMLLSGLSCLLALVLLDQLISYFPLISLLGALGRGLFWAANNIFTLREVHGHTRAKLMGTIVSIGLLMEVVIPFAAGAIIDSSGYKAIMACGAVLYFVAAIFPAQYQKVPTQVINFRELNRIVRQRELRRWSLITIFCEMLSNQRSLIISILPFILLKNELQVGIFASAMGLVSALLAFSHRNDNLKQQLKLAYAGGSVIDIATFVFVFIWTLPALVVRELLIKVGAALYLPSYANLVYRNRELLLGDFIQESAVEMETYAEFLLLVGRMINIIFIALIVYLFTINLEDLLKFLLLLTVPYELIALLLHQRLNKQLLR